MIQISKLIIVGTFHSGYITAYKKPDKKKQLTLTGIKACNHQDNATMQEKRKYPFRKTQRMLHPFKPFGQPYSATLVLCKQCVCNMIICIMYQSSIHDSLKIPKCLNIHVSCNLSALTQKNS